ncbi:HAMP domain-containing sensor histidine kinase [Pedobacter sp. Du54]|uniref:sensor histidine kinase n=1 Tax=Pedobacter anseongensis TaxID=3133439 RepID=UPI0030A6F98B
MPKFNYRNHNLKNNFWRKLIGSPDEFPLESRIFHSISAGLIVLASLYVPYNLYAKLYFGSLSALVFGLFFSYQYYHSRFRGKPHNNIIFGLAGIVIFGLNYFTNSGIDGSTDLIWPAYLLLIFAISPYRQHIIWLIVYLIGFIIIHTIEFYFPTLVKHPFIAGKGQFIDRITAFPLPVILTYLIIKFIRRSYDVERNATEEKTLALEKSNIEKSKLMSIISHDLRTPLLNIQNYLALMNEIDSLERPALEKELLNSTNNAVEMLSNLLHWSKSQLTGTNVQMIKVNLLEVLLNTLEMEKTHALKKEIDFSYTIPPKLMVTADVDMLQLVVRNLLSNAIKFTSNNGKITIDAQLIANECRLTVSDNGKGIPQDKIENIFSVKAEPSYGTNNEKGVGLGLVLCKEFMEHQGGRISFESKLDEGSSFFIFLPVK